MCSGANALLLALVVSVSAHAADVGWSRNVLSGRRGDESAIPPIVRDDGTNNGAWFSYRLGPANQ